MGKGVGGKDYYLIDFIHIQNGKRADAWACWMTGWTDGWWFI